MHRILFQRRILCRFLEQYCSGEKEIRFMAELIAHGRAVTNVFDLIGDLENDIT